MKNLEFKGYRRPDGKCGVRNHVLVLPTSVCSSDVAKIIASQVPEAVYVANQSGCAQVGRDLEYTLNTIVGYACNPNVYGTVLVSLGCETCQLDLVAELIEKRTCKPLVKLDIQTEGGSIKTVEKGIRAAAEMAAEAGTLERELVPITELMVATECGGSDPTSGLAANPTVGMMADLVVAAGGTAVLSETPEFIGAEHILARRGKTKEISDRIYQIVHDYEHAIKLVGHDIREGNPSPGNKEGGLTTLEEKSLGCIHKGGHSEVTAVYDYAKQVEPKQGLVIMDTPGNDPSSVAAMVAGGCQIVVFSTGRGTPTGNPLAPVIKITGNKVTFANMSDNIDIDASPYIYGTKTMTELGDELMTEIKKVADGKLTKAEALGYTEMAIARVCNYM